MVVNASFKEIAMTVRDVVVPPGRQALYEKYRYSPAVRAGDLLFVSGQVGVRGIARLEAPPEARFKRHEQTVEDRREKAAFGDVEPRGQSGLGRLT